MLIEFLNLNEDPKLDPEIRPVALSQDGKSKPPSYCLPWVEASRYSIQLKSNEEYVIQKGKKSLDAWVVRDGKRIPPADIWAKVPEGTSFVPKNATEAMEKKIHLSQSPSFSSPWQRKTFHSVTLKLGIYWWTPPGWGLFFTTAIHRNEAFRVVEGFVRTDLWHRDVPIVIQPLIEEVRIPKYSPVASVIPVSAEEIQLVKKTDGLKEIVEQMSKKRLNPHIYKKLVLKKS